jgi:hypothetical protein
MIEERSWVRHEFPANRIDQPPSTQHAFAVGGVNKGKRDMSTNPVSQEHFAKTGKASTVAFVLLGSLIRRLASQRPTFSKRFTHALKHHAASAGSRLFRGLDQQPRARSSD